MVAVALLKSNNVSALDVMVYDTGTWARDRLLPELVFSSKFRVIIIIITINVIITELEIL